MQRKAEDKYRLSFEAVVSAGELNFHGQSISNLTCKFKIDDYFFFLYANPHQVSSDEYSTCQYPLHSGGLADSGERRVRVAGQCIMTDEGKIVLLSTPQDPLAVAQSCTSRHWTSLMKQRQLRLEAAIAQI